MPRIVDKDESVHALLERLVDVSGSLVDRDGDPLVLWILQDHHVLLGKTTAFETSLDHFDIFHGLGNVGKAFLSFNFSQLVVLAAPNDDGLLDVNLVVG